MSNQYRVAEFDRGTRAFKQPVHYRQEYVNFALPLYYRQMAHKDSCLYLASVNDVLNGPRLLCHLPASLLPRLVDPE